MFSERIAPYIRDADFAVRTPRHTPPRRLLAYLFLFGQEGECLVEVKGEEILLSSGDMCLIQPNTVHSPRCIANAITPHVPMDVFCNPRREDGFPSRGGQVSLSAHMHLMQPRLRDLGWLEVPVQLQPKQPYASAE